MKKVTPFVRFAIGGLYAINFLLDELKKNILELDMIDWIGEITIILVTVTYSAYCIKQGIRELKNSNLDVPYLRILAILVELVNVAAFFFFLKYTSELENGWLLLNILITTGMAYLLIQNLRILTGKS